MISRLKDRADPDTVSPGRQGTRIASVWRKYRIIDFPFAQLRQLGSEGSRRQTSLVLMPEIFLNGVHRKDPYSPLRLLSDLDRLHGEKVWRYLPPVSPGLGS